MLNKASNSFFYFVVLYSIIGDNMKNKKGFTLVELLAVIAILAILVIIALPNVMGMFNSAKKSPFTTELKEIYKVAQQEWMMDSMNTTDDQVYSRCKTCTGKSLQLSGRSELEYYIKVDKSGKVVKYYATDGTYQFSYDGDLLATQINDVEEIAALDKDDVLVITDGGVVEKTYYISPSGSDSAVGDETHPFLTIGHAISKLGNKTGNIYIMSDMQFGDTQYDIKSDVTILSYGNNKYTVSPRSASEFSSVFAFKNTEKTNAKVTLQNLIIDGKGARGVQTQGADLLLNNVDIKNGNLSDYSGICFNVSNANVVLNDTNLSDCHGAVGGAIELYNATMTMNGGSVNNSSGRINQASAMSFKKSNVIFNNTKFNGNYSDNNIAFASIDKDSKVVFNSVQASNTTSHFGGMSVSGELEINNSTFDKFIENKGYGTGSVVKIQSGGKVTIKGSTFTNCESNMGLLSASGNTNITISDSTFTGNKANHAGAIYTVSNSKVTIYNTTFKNNTAFSRYGGTGGAIVSAGTLTLNNCIIENNQADKMITSERSQGGGLNINGGVVTLNGGSIKNNTADVGADIFVSTSGSVVNNGASIGTCSGC